jgi:hypothetical protein
MADELLEVLRPLEEELHRAETRRDINRMWMLLHPEFEEIGRSGRRYTREDILRECAGANEHAVIRAHSFALFPLAADVALLTYTSAYVEASGVESRFALRSSLWIRTPAGWQMRFHQGTPAETETEHFP